MTALLDLIKTRRSVRTFDERPVSPEDRAKLTEYIGKIADPFGIPVEFVLLDAAEYGLSSPVLTGEKLYVAGKVAKRPCADVAFGYAFERLVLYAWSLGIGTTWIGGTMKRDLFEKAAGLREGEMMPCVSPLGYPAKKKSLRETMMRKGVGADSRMPAEKLFFDGSFEQPLSGAVQETIADLIEMVRWAPSAVNKQPWRVIVQGQKVHFYEKPDKGYVSEKTGDLQRIDVGIGMYHFVYGMEARGLKPVLLPEDPGIEVPSDWQDVATFDVEDEQIRRILYYEGLLNKAQDLLARDELTEGQAAELREAAGELDIYLSSGEWRSDFEDDEAGLLPKDLPRGVLSEDGIYNVLEASAARLS